jgi:methyl-accepting chemotaxis protein
MPDSGAPGEIICIMKGIMRRDFTIQRKLLLPILVWVTFVLVLSAVATVAYIRKLAVENVRTESMALIRLNASEITRFFTGKGESAGTFFGNPFFLDFFERYDRFRAPIRNDDGYRMVTESFQEILRSDSTVHSIFFATESTGEYFDEEGRYEEDGYSAKSRSWWGRTMAEGRLYCGAPDFDFSDSTCSTTMQMPVYGRGGRLLGIGGLDILIETVENTVGRIRYRGQGHGFLVDGQGRIILFPDIPHEKLLTLALSEIDRAGGDAAGFKALASRMAADQEGWRRVRWKGKSYIALFAAVSADLPRLNWKLGLLVPENLITGPVLRITALSLLIVCLCILCVFGLTARIVSKTVRPLDALAFRLDEMANREGDLTQQLPVETDDAIGVTARNFNTFISQIRQLLINIIRETADLVNRMSHLHQQSESISEGAKLMTRQAQLAAVTSDQMMRTVDEIGKGVARVVESSAKSGRSVNQGEVIVRQRSERMQQLQGRAAEIAAGMERLNAVSAEVSRAVDVIKDITEQVSLLSMNASIEAVRAGESGRAFSVVAEEIKNLSERTAQENRKTSAVIQNFQKQMDAFRIEIRDMQDRITEESASTEALYRTFEAVLEAVNHATAEADSMKNQTERQSSALRGINENIQSISEASDQIAHGILESFAEITVVNDHVKGLSHSAGAFRVE